MEIKNFVEIKNLNDYLINEMGVVFSKKSDKELKAHNGTVEVYVDGQKRKMNVAHMVLNAFVGNPHNAKRVHHKNGDVNDSSLENVEWIIPKTNKTGVARTSSKSTSSRVKEIAKRRRELEKEMRALENEMSTITKDERIATLVKENVTPIIEGIIQGEKIVPLTQRILGTKLPKSRLERLVKEQCNISLKDIMVIARLQKTNPNFIKEIVKLHKSKLSNVVFKNVA